VPEAPLDRGRAWQTALLALALVALLPVGYYLWQMRGAAGPQSAAAALREEPPAATATPATLAQAPKPADATPAGPPAKDRRQAGLLKEALAADLSYHLDPDTARGLNDLPQRAVLPPVALAVPLAAPPAPQAAGPTEPSGGPASPIDTPRTDRNEKPVAPEPTADAPKFRLTSVVVGRRKPTAIINGQVLAIGDLIEGAKVVAISPTTADLEIAGRRVTLRM
jgi:hypothetical protein